MLSATNTPTIHSRLSSPDPEVRRIAVMNLLDSEEDGISALLLIALKDADANVRAEAARLLEGFETREAVAGLVDSLQDSDTEVCVAAAMSLSELKEPPMGDVLLAALTKSITPFAQAALFRSLRELRRAEAFAPALAALKADAAEVRCAALGVLGYLKSDEALAEIARIAGTDTDPEARRIAVGALGFATNLAAVTPALKKALHDTSWQVREEATATLGKLLAADATEDLIAAMADPYWQVRIRAARSLGKLKACAALPVLIDALSHEVSNLRKEAAIALGEVGDKSAIPALETAIHDTDPDVRKLAQIALNQILK